FWIGDNQCQPRCVLYLSAVAGERDNWDTCAPPKLVLDQLTHCGLHVGLVIERSPAIAHDLFQRRLVADPKTVGTGLANEIGAILQREGSIVDGRGVQLRLAERETELREMGDLVRLPA